MNNYEFAVCEPSELADYLSAGWIVFNNTLVAGMIQLIR